MENELTPYLSLDLKDIIKTTFPQDRLEPVSDTEEEVTYLHHVWDMTHTEAYGRILFRIQKERTWNPAWIKNLRNARESINPKPDFAILVVGELRWDSAGLAMLHGIPTVLERFAFDTLRMVRSNLVAIVSAKSVRSFQLERAEELTQYLLGGPFLERLNKIGSDLDRMYGDLLLERKKFPAEQEAELAELLTQVGAFYRDFCRLAEFGFKKPDILEKLVKFKRLRPLP